MGKKISLYPSEPRSTQVVTIGDTQYSLTFTWYERLKAWYMNVHTIDGVAVVVGRRLSTGSGPLFGLLPESKPTGILYVRGKGDYDRGDLGDNVLLIHYADSEIPAVTEQNPVRVVVT